MSIVTLLSDWGTSDHYLAAVKGKLYSEWSNVNIVDISHQIAKYDLVSAAYVFKNAFMQFPVGTIHCLGINDSGASNKPHLLVKTNGHYIIGADNGIFDLIFDKKPEQAWKILLSPDGSTRTFPSLDLFPLVASYVGKGGDPSEIGEPYDWNGRNFNLRTGMPIPEHVVNPSTQLEEGWIHGSIIYVDSYGNGVSNIDMETFGVFFAKYEHFEIKLQTYFPGKHKNAFNSINEVYKDNIDGDLCAIFLGNGYLEISLNKASAANLLNIRIGSDVKIYFH